MAGKAFESSRTPSQVASLGLAPGDKAEASKTITDAEIQVFSNLSGDDNPLHVDEAFAQKTRFHGCIGQGILTASLISTALTRLTKGAFVYTSQDLHFTGPVHPGDTITATAQVAKILERGKVRFRTVCLNQRGETVLEGFAEMKRLKEVSP